MTEPIDEVPVSDTCCTIFGPLFVLSQLPDPEAEKVAFDGVFDVESYLDYLLDIPHEQQVPVQVGYLNGLHEGVRRAFLQGAYVEGYGRLLIDYDKERKPHLCSLHWDCD